MCGAADVRMFKRVNCGEILRGLSADVMGKMRRCGYLRSADADGNTVINNHHRYLLSTIKRVTTKITQMTPVVKNPLNYPPWSKTTKMNPHGQTPQNLPPRSTTNSYHYFIYKQLDFCCQLPHPKPTLDAVASFNARS